MNRFVASALSLMLGCHSGGSSSKSVVTPKSVLYEVTAIPLPGGTPEGIVVDHIAFDAQTGFIWVPAGGTGSVDVIDTGPMRLNRIEGFATQSLEEDGTTYVAGPSSVAIGRDLVYIGNRGDSSICAMDRNAATRSACVTLDTMPDGLAYVASTDEVWVTAPREKSIRILDGKTLAVKAQVPLEGTPEGFAVDGTRARIYTNLADKAQTLAIDINTHETVAKWRLDCRPGRPRGLALAEAEGLLLVACNNSVRALEVAEGKMVGMLATGEGVDHLDYLPATHALYAAAATTGTLTIVNVSPTGALTLRDTVTTKPGGRNAVVGPTGTVYLAVGRTSELLIVAAKRP